MKIKKISDIKKDALVEHETLIEAFKDYLMREFDYDEEDATIASDDLQDPYNTPYILEDFQGRISIDGIDYEVRFCHTDFNYCGLFHMANAAPFEFYMLIDCSTLHGQTIGDYMKARKIYVI